MTSKNNQVKTCIDEQTHSRGQEIDEQKSEVKKIIDEQKQSSEKNDEKKTVK